MTKLTCHVTTCASNQNSCCCQPAIKVQGRSACKCRETECQSFQKKGRAEVTNSTQFSNANESLTVKCTAEKCVYNRTGDCTAPQITIGGHSAQTRNETNCESFQER